MALNDLYLLYVWFIKIRLELFVPVSPQCGKRIYCSSLCLVACAFHNSWREATAGARSVLQASQKAQDCQLRVDLQGVSSHFQKPLQRPCLGQCAAVCSFKTDGKLELTGPPEDRIEPSEEEYVDLKKTITTNRDCIMSQVYI